MILITKEFSCKSNYDFRKIGPLESLLFFDIETTGLSAMTSSLYLIGCVYYKEERWHYTQWFSECMADEAEILKQFFSFSKTSPISFILMETVLTFPTSETAVNNITSIIILII